MMQERWVQWAVGTVCLIMQVFTNLYTTSSSSKLSGCLCTAALTNCCIGPRYSCNLAPGD